jgi:hypothetical protein
MVSEVVPSFHNPRRPIELWVDLLYASILMDHADADTRVLASSLVLLSRQQRQQRQYDARVLTKHALGQLYLAPQYQNLLHTHARLLQQAINQLLDQCGEWLHYT